MLLDSRIPGGRVKDLRPAVVFVLAYAVRLLYVLQIQHAPYFDVPLIDGPNYFRMAAVISSGSLTGGHQVFWQPPLYSYFLAVLFATIGNGMLAIYAVQAAVGSLSCVLVYCIGKRLFDARSATAAGLIAALYGPLIHFDAQPLIPVVHIVLVLGGFLMLLRAAGIGEPAGLRRARFFSAGLLWGLAATATPNILLAVPPAAAWGWRRMRAAGVAGLLVAGVGLPVLIVTARNVLVARDAVLISSNGGLNFFVGNNPDYERTIRLRPGGEFERLAQEPENLGIVKASARSRWFASRAGQFLRDHPGEALRLYARKTGELIAGREIPRNQDPYVYRRESWLLALLLWRFGISFPFGLVAPLALAGLFVGGQASEAQVSGRRLLLLYAAAYAVSILLFFPTDRYRLPLVPVAALLAGRMLAALPGCLKRPIVPAAFLCGLILFNLDARTPGEVYPEEEALNTAYALRVKGRPQEARDAYLKAMALNPRRIDPYNSLAVMAAEEGRWDEAAARYEALLEIAPDFADVRRSLGEAYRALGRKEDAWREWRAAVDLAPGLGLALDDMCMSAYEDGATADAEAFCERAVQARPDLPETHLSMGLIARALQRRDRARAELTEAARLFPRGSPGGKRAAEILEKMRRRDARLSGEPSPTPP
jgi:tetratricopeptide (TPR) repeat protein